MSEYLKSSEAAAFLGISISYLSRLRYLKKGPPYRKISRNLTIYEVIDLEEYKSSQLAKDLGKFNIDDFPKIYPK